MLMAAGGSLHYTEHQCSNYMDFSIYSTYLQHVLWLSKIKGSSGTDMKEEAVAI